MGPRACSFWVEMPISHPRPNSPPSVKRGGCVHVDRRAVHTGDKPVGCRPILRDDGIAVMGGVGADVADGVLQAVHHPHGQDIVEKLGVKILRPGGHTRDDGRGTLVQPQFHRGQLGGQPIGYQAVLQQGQKRRGHIPVHQADLLGVADAGAAGLGVVNDVDCHLQIGSLVHIHMADAGAGLDAGHGGVGHTGCDQPLAAPGNQQVHQTVGGHQRVGRSMGGILNQAHCRLGQARLPQAPAQRLHNGMAAAPGIPPAAQHTGAARLQGQRRSIGGDVGAAFVNNGDHAHGHRGFFNQQAVGPQNALAHLAHRVGQGGHLSDALGHICQAGVGQCQPVQHHLRHPAPGVFQVGPVGLQNLPGCRHQRHGHSLQRSVFAVGRRQCQRLAGRLCCQ